MAGETGKTTSRMLNKMQYNAANKADTITLATGDIVFVSDISDDYKVGKTTVGDLATAAGNKVYVTLDIADGSAEAVYYLLSPVAGTISKIYTVTDGAVGTADITITPAIGATGVTNGVVTIATAASAAGDIDVATPTAANTITAWAAVNFTVTGGGSGGSPRIHLVMEVTRT